MDGATIQARAYRGYAIAAAKIGLPTDQYRPADANDPLDLTKIATLPASFNAEDMSYGKPSKYGKPTWFCLIDGTQVQVGDYLLQGNSTFFIAAMQPLLPILAVECNRTVSLYRPQQQTGVGVQGYGGNTAANETSLAQNWPVSLLQAAKAASNPVNLPGDAKQASWTLLMPAIPGGAVIKNDDVVIDDLGSRYLVYSAELSDLGWRMQLTESET